MSEKLSPAVRESDEKSKEAAFESKECSSKKKTQTPMEEEEEVIAEYEIVSTPEKLEDLEISKLCQSKIASEISASDKPEDSENPENPENSEDPEVPKICRVLKEMHEDFLSDESEDSEDYEVPKECELSEIMSEISMFDKSENPEDPETSKICQLPKTTSEICTSLKEDVPKDISRLPKSSDLFTSIETSKVPDTWQVFDILPEVSSFLGTPKISGIRQLPQTVSEIPPSVKPETAKVPEKCQGSIETSKFFPYIESEAPKVPKASQLRKATSEISASSRPENPKEIRRTYSSTSEMSTGEGIIPTIPEVCQSLDITSATSALDKPETSEAPDVCQSPKTTPEISTSDKPEDSKDKECQMPEIDESSTSACAESEKTLGRDTSKMGAKDKSKEVYQLRIPPNFVPIGYYDAELGEINEMLNRKNPSRIKGQETNKLKNIMSKKSEEIFREKTEIISVLAEPPYHNMHNKIWSPISMPSFKERPLVLATQNLVPSLSIRLFEVLAEIIEVVTKKPVILMHEGRFHRPIPDIVDIVVLPAANTWSDGVLLPASFIFRNRSNKTRSPDVYVSVIVSKDRAPHIKNIKDLRGYKCAMPIHRSKHSAAGVLFDYLRTKGENMLFFGNILDARTQVDVLHMVASKQVDVGILEAPVITSNKFNVSDIESLQILTTVGPLPPYRIMVKNTQADKLIESLTTYLLTLHQYNEWLERLSPFGVIGFAENSMDKYEPKVPKSINVATNTPYY